MPLSLNVLISEEQEAAARAVCLSLKGEAKRCH